VVSCFRPCTQFLTWLMHLELEKRGSWCLFSMIACSINCCLQSGKEIHCQVSDVVWIHPTLHFDHGKEKGKLLKFLR
jgi:hypothetical protein